MFPARHASGVGERTDEMNQAIEMLRHAEINFRDTMPKMNPQLKDHPIYQLALMQLQEGISAVECHRCDLPDSVKESLNSGDGVYRP